MNRYCWCQYASPLCTAGRTAATCPCCRMTSVLQCCCCSDDGTGYKQLYTLLQDSGQWTHCLSYLYAESRVFLQPVSPDSAAARHVVQTLSIQYNYVCEGEVRDHFCGQGSWRGKEAWLCQLIDWVRLLGHSNGNSSHFRLCEQICFVLSMVYIWTAQLSLQCSRRLQESSTPFVYRRRAAARPSHHDSLAWKAFWLKVESLKSFSHATGVDCFETITIACPVLS